jgi:hypothetical protein
VGAGEMAGSRVLGMEPGRCTNSDHVCVNVGQSG